MGLFGKGLFARHELDRWRDEWTLIASATLNEVAANLAPMLDADIKAASMREVLTAPGALISTRLAPKVRAVTGPIVDELMNKANDALRGIVEHQAVWSKQMEGDVSPSGPFEGMGDLALAAAPLAGGAAVAAAIPVSL